MAQFVFNAVKRYLPVILWILLAGPSEAGAQSFLQRPSMRLHHLQGSLMAGAARLAKNGDHGTGYSFVLKEQYHFTGVLYSSVGVGLTYVQGQHLYPPEKEPLHYHSSYLSLPIGGGFDMGDDRGRFYTGIDVLPAYFFDAYPDVPSQRRWALGFGLELGFTIKVGPADKRGFQLGMQGQWKWLPPYSMTDRRGLVYSFAGGGIVVRF